jgi:hypothetical protein
MIVDPILSPNACMGSAGGPMNATLCGSFSSDVGRFGFSLAWPHMGMTASTLWRMAISQMRLMLA